MKQLTFRGNYRDFSAYHQKTWGEFVDFETNPELLLETRYAARSALYFWDRNELYKITDKGTTKKESYAITAKVNLHDDHYEDRYRNLTNFMDKGVFNDLF
ncbi:hypothetical protein [Siccibacter turicensis]|uniref:hypothetical protein n=1 Tax=Siccibacter turicensis TaxID=357233 RepID=UPI0023F2E690|nr:hypothetical protein [Siccibacter turicensis]